MLSRAWENGCAGTEGKLRDAQVDQPIVSRISRLNSADRVVRGSPGGPLGFPSSAGRRNPASSHAWTSREGCCRSAWLWQMGAHSTASAAKTKNAASLEHSDAAHTVFAPSGAMGSARCHPVVADCRRRGIVEAMTATTPISAAIPATTVPEPVPPARLSATVINRIPTTKACFSRR